MNVDIKCINHDCPLKKKCQRYTKPSLYTMEIYALFLCDEKDGCQYYWDKDLPDPCGSCGGQLIHYEGCFKNN